MEMKRYRNSAVYPISEEAIKSIAANMRLYGYDERFPIVVINDNEIIDGYHRYEASRRAGVEPVTVPFEGTEENAFEYIMRANGDRRHLNGGQKASAAILINRKLGHDAKSTEEMAEVSGVSQSHVNQLASFADSELEDIISGKKTQKEVKASRTEKRKSSTPVRYTLTKTQIGTCGMLSAALNDPVNKIVARAFAAGLAALDDEARMAMASK